MTTRASIVAALAVSTLALSGCAAGKTAATAGQTPGGDDLTPPDVLGLRGTVDPALLMTTGSVRIAYLHHSTGGVVWGGGVKATVDAWNDRYGTHYQIAESDYPATAHGYPWANYPYDYWNLWVSHQGASRDRQELNLDDLAAAADVIVWKHCFPVSSIDPDDAVTDVASSHQTLANYRAQYAALKARMKEFPTKRFVVWTPTALLAASTSAAEAQRARAFSTWVKTVWDEPGDNIFVWDFRALEADADGLYLPIARAASQGDDHPSNAFGAFAAPQVARRIIDVIEGRGDTGSLTGRP